MMGKTGIILVVHIRKVEIFGFKSFGFRNTVVDFRPGLVSISGPNGSGKSNILDAIIFASGEMRPKIMRVDKIRSLIHDVSSAGGGSRMARVSVHFENEDRKIPFDSDSVEITRELTAEGENTYYINKKKTQRTHVIDMLEMANAGLHQLNAVQQGTVTRISEFTSEEKRKSIEDLVGMSAFDEKKTAAQKQLDAADNKLNVALATMGQIKAQIDDLEVQRNRQMRHSFIEGETARLRAESAAGKIYNLNKQGDAKSKTKLSLKADIASADGNLTEIRANIKSVESEKSEFLAKLDKYNKEKAHTDSELAKYMASYEQTRAALDVAKNRIGQIDVRVVDLKKKINESEEIKNTAESNAKSTRESLEKLESERDRISKQVMDAERRRADVLHRQTAESDRRRGIETKLQEMTRALHGEELAILKKNNATSDGSAKINANAAKMASCAQNTDRLKSLRKNVESIRQSHRGDAVKIASVISSLTAKKEKAERDLEDLEFILEKSSKAGTRYDSKIRTVKNLMHEDYSVAKLKEHAPKLGILGLVYELLSWDEKYERAMLASGSEWVKAIVVKDFETLVALAEYARRQNLPKIKIIPLDALSTVGRAGRRGDETIGMLSEYVKCQPQYRPLAEFLFGNVALVPSKEAAHTTSNSGIRSVTLEGESFESNSSAVVIDINSRISKIAQIISMSMSVQGLLDSVSILKKHVQAKKSAVKRASVAISERESLLHAANAGVEKAQSSQDDLDRNLENAATLYGSLQKRMDDIQKERTSSQSYVKEISLRIESLKSEIDSQQKVRASIDIESIETDLQSANDAKSVLDAEHSGTLEEYGKVSSEGARLEADVIKYSEAVSLAQKEIQSLGAEKTEKTSEIENLGHTLQEQNKVLVALRSGEQKMIASQGGSTADLEEYDERIRQMRRGETALVDSKSAAVRRSDGIERDLSDIATRVTALQKTVDSYGRRVEYDTSYDPEPLLHGLESEQRTLGALNATAPAKYLEISSGYRSMSTRKNMLEGERNSIVRFIEEVERDKRQTFLDAFDIVDKQVRTIFSKMTGGSAWLELQNEDDIFSSGISYILQFANKPKRESTSISGGEKTLAAIVFVLALQKLKPSPFYLFDEVDAHLDAPNAEKLSNILEERSRESQFIMVSLKDSVVSKASLIYGVYPRKGDAASQVVQYKDKRLPAVTQKA